MSESEFTTVTCCKCEHNTRKFECPKCGHRTCTSCRAVKRKPVPGDRRYVMAWYSRRFDDTGVVLLAAKTKGKAIKLAEAYAKARPVRAISRWEVLLLRHVLAREWTGK
jgi:hypothetical protein